jgi:hypothetical protein
MGIPMMLENYMEEKHIPPIQHALRIIKQNHLFAHFAVTFSFDIITCLLIVFQLPGRASSYSPLQNYDVRVDVPLARGCAKCTSSFPQGMRRRK